MERRPQPPEKDPQQNRDRGAGPLIALPRRVGLGVYRFRRRQVRRLDAAAGALEIQVELLEPLPASICGRLLLEGVGARESPIRGLLDVAAADVARDRVRIVVGPVARPARRFDLWWSELPPAVGPAKLGLAEYFVRQLVEHLKTLAREPARPRFEGIHGRLYDRSILLEPSGELRLIGGGFSGLTELQIPPPSGGRSGHGFIAPEVLREEPPTDRSDVYSVGALLYQLVTHLPYRHRLSELELRAAAFSARAVDLPPSIDDAPDGLLDLIAWTLAPDPALRCDSVSTLQDELNDILRHASFERLESARFAELFGLAKLSDVDHGLRAFGAVAVDSPLDRPVPVIRRRAPSSVVPIDRVHAVGRRRPSVVELDRRADMDATPRPPRGTTVELPAIELERLRELSVEELGPDTDASQAPLAAAAFSEPLETQDLMGGGADYTGDLVFIEPSSRSLPWLLLALGLGTGLVVWFLLSLG